jgi:hypothetical protein
MATVRGSYPNFAWALPFRHLTATALAVMMAGSLVSTAGAQVPPTSQIPEKIEPPLSPPSKDDKEQQFNRKDGVIRPPSNIDPEMETKPRDKGARTPVIPPPGSPGGDENTKPK